MKPIKYYTADKEAWGPGPWQQEPDKMQWTDRKTGLPCLIVRNSRTTGALCGYVGVSAGHPAYRKPYQDLDESLRVHGGLTFSEGCREGPANEAICHVPAPGESDDVWWLGFDCAHAFDLCPAMRATLREIRKRDPAFDEAERKFDERLGLAPRKWQDVYRNIAYVRRQTQHLAEQLAAMGKQNGNRAR